MKVMTSITVRRLSFRQGEKTRDWDAVYDLCCRTGNNGQPVSPERWGFFGRLWVEPYEKIFPQWTYLAEADGVVVGYLTGCPDSRGFAKAKVGRFALPLLVDVCRGRYSGNGDARRFVRQFLGFEKTPEEAFPRALRQMLQRDYPAHLHMNVEANWRGSGVGTKLIERFFADLSSTGIPRVHLYCGADPLVFYLRRGFTEIGSSQFHGAPVYVLGRAC